jgi:enolase
LQIQEIKARVCFNGRGDPGIETEVWVNGKLGIALSPAGASRGKYEAVPFVDNDVEKTARLVESYKRRLIGLDASDMAALTSVLREIDGTDNFSKIGGSAAYSISVAAAEAEANARGEMLCKVINPQCASLPVPLGNVLGGGKHASALAPSIQEILVAPIGARSIIEAISLNFLIHRKVGELLTERLSYPLGKGDEGAWSPGITDDDALHIVKDAIHQIQDKSGRKIRMGVDIAANSIYDKDDEKFYYRVTKRKLTREEQISFCSELKDRFDLFYIEDPLHEEDFEGYAELKGSLKGTLIVGDDLYTTNTERLKQGISSRSTNGVIVKVNQIGTLAQASQFASLAKKTDHILAASHRSGDNENAHLAHFAVGFECDLIKCGIVGAERTAKLNELIRVGERLGTSKIMNLVLK